MSVHQVCYQVYRLCIFLRNMSSFVMCEILILVSFEVCYDDTNQMFHVVSRACYSGFSSPKHKRGNDSIASLDVMIFRNNIITMVNSPSANCSE